MYSSNFSIKSDCGLSSAAEKTNQSIISLYVYPMGEGKNYVFSFSTNQDNDLLKEYLSKDFISYNIFKGKNVYFIQGIKRGHGMMNSIITAGGIPLFPVVAKDGTESFDFIAYNRKIVDDVIEAASKHNDVTYSDYDNMENDQILSVLSRKQSMIHTMDLTEIEKKVIRKAYKAGYFTWPRDYRLDFMANDFKLSKPTILYHIRNAERKILKFVVD